MENVIIIGGGPAGFSAAIYLARDGFKPLLFAGSPPGGQLSLTSEVENFPGHESILGADLIEKMKTQSAKFGTKILDQNISKVDFTRSPFELESGQKIYQAKSVIIATGAKALWLGLESETRLRGKGVSACATCDGFFFREKTVAVVGGGDTALEEALTLAKFAKKVYLIHRRDSFRACKLMQERVKTNPKIKIIYNGTVEEIMGKEKLEGVKLKILDPRSQIVDKTIKIKDRRSKINDLKVEGVFVAIGHKPDTNIFKNQIKMDEKGYIITSESATSVKGVYAAGDCVDHKYRQAAVAAGMGVAAALEVEKFLET